MLRARLFLAYPRGKRVAGIAAASLAAITVAYLYGQNPLDRPATPATSPARDAANLHPVTINRPAGPPAVDSGKRDHLGQPVMVACSTCHTTRTPDPTNRSAAALDLFHQGLIYKHGDQTCLSCHNAGDYDALRLADGSSLPYSAVMTLCAQCHGPQHRDYLHGAHGGMNGYWDRTRGPRYRNNCIDCHDPHAPAYPLVRPVFKPITRFGPDSRSSKGGPPHE